MTMTAEQEAVLRSIRKLIEFWHIEPEELEDDGFSSSATPPPPPPPAAPKYRHPRTGDTWDGQGSQPQWLREALTKQGYTVEELRAQPDTMPAADATAQQPVAGAEDAPVGV